MDFWVKILAELAREHDLVVISDEIYDAITYDDVTSTCMATRNVYPTAHRPEPMD